MDIKKFLCRALFFLTPLLFTSVLIELALQRIPNDYSYKNSYMKSKSMEIEVLVLGNSHAYRSILADSLELNAFNAGYISQTLDLDYLIFDKFKYELSQLKFLVINISYPSLYSTLKTSKEKWRVKNYNLYYNFSIGFSPSNYSEIIGNTFGVNKKKFLQHYYYKRSIKDCTYKGSGLFYNVGELEKSGLVAAIRHTKPIDETFYKNLDYLNQIISYANDEGVKVILSTPPVYDSYRKNVKEIQLSNMNEAIESFARKYKNVYVFNHYADTTFTKNDFKNADHLNFNGALKYTSLLNSLLKEL